ncbi:hypothetical protein GCM10025782_13280 [Pedococcus ginsenosidimutans]|uniref:Uncharacterized protein n=1 Tax=Pedococcus ginsenosidimutans TaxID=490570 RepID=A0ABP8XYV2_9MICO
MAYEQLVAWPPTVSEIRFGAQAGTIRYSTRGASLRLAGLATTSFDFGLPDGHVFAVAAAAAFDI